MLRSSGRRSSGRPTLLVLLPPLPGALPSVLVLRRFRPGPGSPSWPGTSSGLVDLVPAAAPPRELEGRLVILSPLPSFGSSGLVDLVPAAASPRDFGGRLVILSPIPSLGSFGLVELVPAAAPPLELGGRLVILSQ